MSMQRLVGRSLQEGQVCPNSFDVFKTDLGNGELEYSVRPVVHWHEVATLDDWALLQYRQQQQDPELLEQRRERSQRKAAQRAKRKLRQVCKKAGFTDLLTLTYRANVADRDLVVRHLKEFHRRMKRLIPGWQYCAVLEKQKRGALHVHLAIHKVPPTLPARNGVKVKSFNVVRAVWLSIVGELGGNIDISRSRKARRGCGVSQLAGYLSKYIAKAIGEGEDFKRSYFASRDLTPPKAQRIRFDGYTLIDVVDLIYDEIPCGFSEQRRAGLTPGGGFWVFHSPPGHTRQPVWH
ncbi:MAG: hypothetical protein Q4A98_08280 [Comamonadaceae bacterium]|nr:hypothetical protein [Comamonadaceae bacterium]